MIVDNITADEEERLNRRYHWCQLMRSLLTYVQFEALAASLMETVISFKLGRGWLNYDVAYDGQRIFFSNDGR